MSNKKKLILVGAGGHCKSCIEVIEAQNKYSIVGILDKQEKKGQKVFGYSIVGTDDDIESLILKQYSFLVTVGQIKNFGLRKKLFERLKLKEAKLASIVSPAAKVSDYAEVGEGTVIMHGVTVNADAKVGVNCILNTNCTIEHEAHVGNHCHISTHAVVNGDCIVKDGCFIGSGSVLVNGVQIHPSVVIGAGSVVTKNIDQAGTFVGSPAKKI